MSSSGSVWYYVSVGLGAILLTFGTTWLLKKPFFRMVMAATRQLDIILDDSLSEREQDRRILRHLGVLLKQLGATISVAALVVGVSLLPTILYVRYSSIGQVDTRSLYFWGSMVLGGLPFFFSGKRPLMAIGLGSFTPWCWTTITWASFCFEKR